MPKQKANERKFRKWEETINGRLYTRKVEGQKGWYAIYYKEVDKEEKTLRFWQEIFDEQDKLRAIHHKYPEDKGHQQITDL